MIPTRNFSKSLLPIQGIYQDYAWGKDINTSILGFFKDLSPDIPPSHRAAELWFGIHKNGCSKVLHDSSWKPLDSYVREISAASFNSLAKILTIGKPLSIQLHPNRGQAEALHAKNSVLFPDKNPKPEMAIALCSTELLCGVRAHSEIYNFLSSHPLSTHFLPKEISTVFNNEGVKKVFELVFNTSSNFDRSLLHQLLSSLPELSEHDRIALNVVETFDSIDAGIIALYFLSHLKLIKGQSIYIQPNIPHAYLAGELFECMMNSDNVVRGGLTSKPIDNQNFLNLLDVSQYNPIIEGKKHSDYCTIYDIQDLPFILEKIELNSQQVTITELDSRQGQQLIIITDGAGIFTTNRESHDARTGSSFYYNSNDAISLKSSNIVAFRLINRC